MLKRYNFRAIICSEFKTYLDYSLTNILRKMNSQTVPKKGYVTDR